MAVSKDKVRTIVTIPVEIKKKLEELSEKDQRSYSNYVANVLIKHVEEKTGE